MRDGCAALLMLMSSAVTASAQGFVPIVKMETGLLRNQMTAEQTRTTTAAIETFKTEQQLDDARRLALVTQLRAVLTDEESDNFRAALARRPVVQAPGMVGGIVGGISAPVQVLNQLRNAVAVTAPLP